MATFIILKTGTRDLLINTDYIVSVDPGDTGYGCVVEISSVEFYSDNITEKHGSSFLGVYSTRRLQPVMNDFDDVVMMLAALNPPSLTGRNDGGGV